MGRQETALIVGAGLGLSASLARRDTGALALQCDATSAADCERAFQAVEARWGIPDLAVYRHHRSAWSWELELRPWVEKF